MEIKVMKNILGENDRIAAENQALFKEKNVYVINLMGSPGAGKTSVLEKTMERLKDKVNMAVIEGDLFTSKDAERIEKHGVPGSSRWARTRRASCSPSPRAMTSR